MANILTMDVQTVPITQVTPYPGNARQGDQKTIAHSLATNGQYRPLVVQQSTGHVLCGNNTLAAAHQLGWTEISVQYVNVNDTQAKKILLVDNRANDEATYDDQLLLDLLEDLNTIDDLSGTGFETDAIDDLRKATDALGTPATAFLDPFNPTSSDAQRGRDNPITAPQFTPTPTPPPEPGAAPDSSEHETPGEHHPNTPTPAPPANPQPIVHYVAVSYTITEDERTELRAAVRHAQEHGNLETQSDALIAIIRAYNQEHGL